MRVFAIAGSDTVYSCISYLVLGDWNRIEDVNTLIDAGSDASIVRSIAALPTGFGKRAVEQVILTHGHFDHVGGLEAVVGCYHPTVYAFGKSRAGESELHHEQHLRVADRDFQVLHTPGHTGDSLCLYCAAEKALFSGDTMVQIRGPGGSYSMDFVRSLERLAALDVDVIYPGHGGPLTVSAGAMLRESLYNVHKSTISLGEQSVT